MRLEHSFLRVSHKVSGSLSDIKATYLTFDTLSIPLTQLSQHQSQLSKIRPITIVATPTTNVTTFFEDHVQLTHVKSL